MTDKNSATGLRFFRDLKTCPSLWFTISLLDGKTEVLLSVRLWYSMCWLFPEKNAALYPAQENAKVHIPHLLFFATLSSCSRRWHKWARTGKILRYGESSNPGSLYTVTPCENSRSFFVTVNTLWEYQIDALPTSTSSERKEKKRSISTNRSICFLSSRTALKLVKNRSRRC